MSAVVAGMAAEAERPEAGVPPFDIPARGSGPARAETPYSPQRRRERGRSEEYWRERLPAHQFPPKTAETWAGNQLAAEEPRAASLEASEAEQERRIYRGRTVAMLRRYMRYAIETGRLPSLLGREFFRTKVTKYSVVTFEDRVIFVHDMEICLERLDEFSRQLIARHILQEHDCWATARLLRCNERTVRRLTPFALDELSGILLEVGLMERIGSQAKNSCQGGGEGEIFASDCENGKNKL
jgi:hypothetical protein